MSDEDDIFSRWSRRKRQVAKETEAPVATVDATAEQPPEVTAEEDEDEAAILEKFNLPVPETMQKGDDFSGFMQAGVPEFLRKRALRVLWRSNPVLAHSDDP